MKTRNVHLTITGERTHVYVIVGHDRSINTDLDSSNRWAAGRRSHDHTG
jgi:hypothetical protein